MRLEKGAKGGVGGNVLNMPHSDAKSQKEMWTTAWICFRSHIRPRVES